MTTHKIQRKRQSWLLVLGLLLATGVAACGSSPPPVVPTSTPAGPQGSLVVLAATSLKEAFTEAAGTFRAANPGLSDPQFNFAGSQALVAQLQQGAPADVFASADKANM